MTRFTKREKMVTRAQTLASIAHKPGSSPTPRFSLFKSNSPSEPLPERLHSAKISRALWLVGFSG